MELTPGILPVQSVQSNRKYTFALPKDQSQILSYLQFISLMGWGLASCLGYLLICSLGDLRQKVPEFLFYYLLLGMIYLVSFKIAAVQGIGSKFPNLTNQSDLDAISSREGTEHALTLRKMRALLRRKTI